MREPLVHFLVISALLFVAYSALRGGSEKDGRSIVVSRGRIEHLAAGFTRAWRRPPTAQELSGLVDDYVRDEVYYREAIAMRLDRDDTVIRRRLRQKLEFLLDDAAAVEPSDADLEAYRLAQEARFRSERRLTFDQIYIGSRERDKTVETTLRMLRTRLHRSGASEALDALGNTTLLPRSLVSATRREIEQQFGPQFASSLEALQPSRDWHGPLVSAYGLHLVRVRQRVEGELPPLGTVREAVRREWMNEQRRLAIDAHFHKLLGRYTVSVEGSQHGPSSMTSGGAAQR